MRKLLLAGILTILALPAAASDCHQLTITDGAITSPAPEQDLGVSWALFGHSGAEYMTLQVQVGADRGLGEGIGTSRELEGNTGIATVCPDGSIGWAPAETAVPEPVPVEEPAELLTESEVEELRPETRAVYVATHPGTGGLQEF